MATTFTGFSNLPKELQLQIWVYAIPGPRLVYLNFEKDIRIQLSKFFYECDRAPRRNIAAIYTHANCAPPALLHVCSTSREVALKHYSLAFAAPQSEYGPIYFDFSRDTLLLDHDMPWHMVSTTLEWHSFLNAEESNRVQFLALTTELVTTHALTQWDSKLVCAVETFPRLQNITVVKSGPRLVYPALTWRDMTAGNFESWWYSTRRFSRFFSGPVVSRYTSTKTMMEFFRKRFRGWKAPLIRHVEDIKALKKINCV